MIHIVVKVIDQAIVCAVMLMMAGALSARSDIHREHLVPGAFVCVVGPSAIVKTLYVMAYIVDDGRPRLMTKRVYASHIACNR